MHVVFAGAASDRESIVTWHHLVMVCSLATSERPALFPKGGNGKYLGHERAAKRGSRNPCDCIKADHPHIVIIGMSVHRAQQVESAMSNAGASAFIHKEAAVDKLHQTILAVRQSAAKAK